MNTKIRNVYIDDIPQLKKVIDSSELFPSELLDDMISNYLTNKSSGEIWITSINDDDIPISIAFCVPEKLTEGTYNLYALAVHKEYQGKGIGCQIVQYLENQLAKQKQHLLIIETSGLPSFHLTRKFYEKLDYKKEAIIKDFYSKGDDKVIFTKRFQ